MASYAAWREGIQRVQGLESPAHVVDRVNAGTDDVVAWMAEDAALGVAFGDGSSGLHFEGLTQNESADVVAQSRLYDELRFAAEALRVRGELGEELQGLDAARYERMREEGPGMRLPIPPPPPPPPHRPGSPCHELGRLRLQRQSVLARVDRLRFAARSRLHQRKETEILALWAQVADTQHQMLSLSAVAERDELRGTVFSLTPTIESVEEDAHDDGAQEDLSPAKSSAIALTGRIVDGVDIRGVSLNMLAGRAVGTWRSLLPRNDSEGKSTVNLTMRGLGVANKPSYLTERWLGQLARKYEAREAVLRARRGRQTYRHPWPRGVTRMALARTDAVKDAVKNDRPVTDLGLLLPDASRFGPDRRFDGNAWVHVVETVTAQATAWDDVSADPTVKYYPFTFYRRAAVAGSRCALWKYLHSMQQQIEQGLPASADFLANADRTPYFIGRADLGDPPLTNDELERLFAPFADIRPAPDRLGAVAVVPFDAAVLRNEMETTYRLAVGEIFLLDPNTSADERALFALLGEGLPDLGVYREGTREEEPTLGRMHPALLDELVFDDDSATFELDPGHFTQDALYLAAPKFRFRPGLGVYQRLKLGTLSELDATATGLSWDLATPIGSPQTIATANWVTRIFAKARQSKITIWGVGAAVSLGARYIPLLNAVPAPLVGAAASAYLLPFLEQGIMRTAQGLTRTIRGDPYTAETSTGAGLGGADWLPWMTSYGNAAIGSTLSGLQIAAGVFGQTSTTMQTVPDTWAYPRAAEYWYGPYYHPNVYEPNYRPAPRPRFGPQPSSDPVVPARVPLAPLGYTMARTRLSGIEDPWRNRPDEIELPYDQRVLGFSVAAGIRDLEEFAGAPGSTGRVASVAYATGMSEALRASTWRSIGLGSTDSSPSSWGNVYRQNYEILTREAGYITSLASDEQRMAAARIMLILGGPATRDRFDGIARYLDPDMLAATSQRPEFAGFFAPVASGEYFTPGAERGYDCTTGYRVQFGIRNAGTALESDVQEGRCRALQLVAQVVRATPPQTPALLPEWNIPPPQTYVPLFPSPPTSPAPPQTPVPPPQSYIPSRPSPPQSYTPIPPPPQTPAPVDVVDADLILARAATIGRAEELHWFHSVWGVWAQEHAAPMPVGLEALLEIVARVQESRGTLPGSSSLDGNERGGSSVPIVLELQRIYAAQHNRACGHYALMSLRQSTWLWAGAQTLRVVQGAHLGGAWQSTLSPVLTSFTRVLIEDADFWPHQFYRADIMAWGSSRLLRAVAPTQLITRIPANLRRSVLAQTTGAALIDWLLGGVLRTLFRTQTPYELIEREFQEEMGLRGDPANLDTKRLNRRLAIRAAVRMGYWTELITGFLAVPTIAMTMGDVVAATLGETYFGSTLSAWGLWVLGTLTRLPTQAAYNVLDLFGAFGTAQSSFEANFTMGLVANATMTAAHNLESSAAWASWLPWLGEGAFFTAAAITYITMVDYAENVVKYAFHKERAPEGSDVWPSDWMKKEKEYKGWDLQGKGVRSIMFFVRALSKRIYALSGPFAKYSKLYNRKVEEQTAYALAPPSLTRRMHMLQLIETEPENFFSRKNLDEPSADGFRLMDILDKGIYVGLSVPKVSGQEQKEQQRHVTTTTTTTWAGIYDNNNDRPSAQNILYGLNVCRVDDVPAFVLTLGADKWHWTLGQLDADAWAAQLPGRYARAMADLALVNEALTAPELTNL